VLIHKLQLIPNIIGIPQFVELPAFAEIISTGAQGTGPVLWYGYDDEQKEQQNVRRGVLLAFTGEPFTVPRGYAFIGTAQVPYYNQQLVYHVFVEQAHREQ
jgi:hypothetical protein